MNFNFVVPAEPLVDIDDVLALIEQGIDVTDLLSRIDGFQVVDMNELGLI